ncbi:MAG: response regulator transcription factor [Bacteroidaceae bacterium]
MKLLIVEDERELSNGIVHYLTSENYLCEQAFTYNEAKSKLGIYEYDCILLDLMLPGGNGLDLLRLIKERNNPAGVIIVSANGSLEHKIEGLKNGADDYLPKPFHLSELSMRVYALIRRRQFSANNTLQIGEITIHLLNREVEIKGTKIGLTRTEYDLLLYLLGNRERVISKSAIAEHLCGDMADMLDSFNFVYTHIKNLKAKLTNRGCPDYIKTVYGTGYKWSEQ